LYTKWYTIALDVLTLTIDRRRGAPVYEQVADQVRRLVATGELVPGTLLPPVRRLAGDLGVNLNTIARAYRLLVDAGFGVIRDRGGAAVAAPASEVESSVREELLEQMRATVARLRQAGMTKQQLLAVLRREVQAMPGPGRGDSDD
jgi:GntR family transcriptional regulator